MPLLGWKFWEKIASKKKYIVRDSKDPPKSDRYVIEENKLFETPDR